MKIWGGKCMLLASATFWTTHRKRRSFAETADLGWEPLMMLRTLFLIGAAGLFAQDSIVLKTSTLFDGKGKTLHNTLIVVEGGKIARVGGASPAGAVTYDLTAFTVSPGWIDTHSHIVNHFDNDDRAAGRNEPPSQATWHIAGNAVATLNAGFT